MYAGQKEDSVSSFHRAISVKLEFFENLMEVPGYDENIYLNKAISYDKIERVV